MAWASSISTKAPLLRVGPSYKITGCRQIAFTAPPIDFDGKTYAWNFGDGATDTVENPVHVYATPGTYVVTLRITTACFCRESSGGVLVPALPLPGSIAAPQVLCAGTAPAMLTSTVSASGDAGLPLVYQWESSADNAHVHRRRRGYRRQLLAPKFAAAGHHLLSAAGAAAAARPFAGVYCTPSFTASVAITVTAGPGGG